MSHRLIARILGIVGLLSLPFGCGGPRWPIAHGVDGVDGVDGDARHPVLQAAMEKATAPLGTRVAAMEAEQGFAIVPTTTVPSFHFGYTAIFEADQNVYITADAVMHAVHASFDDILIDIETEALIPELTTLLAETRNALAKTDASDTRADLDTFLTVAQALLSEDGATPVAGGDPALVAEFVSAANAAKGPREIALFGSKIDLDFSMLKPRGHYMRTDALQRYFRAMSWLGRAEIRLAHFADNEPPEIHRDALAAAVLLWEVMTPRAKQAWTRIDQALDRMIGPSDSMSLPRFAQAANALALTSGNNSHVDDKTIYDKLRPLAEQRINTQLLTPFERTIPLWTIGQRYIADSEVLSATSYGKLPQKRMMPSALDVGAAIFANPEAHILLKKDYDRYHSLLPAVIAVNERVAALGPKLWEGSMSHVWMHALSGLTRTDVKGLPPFMTTPAWQRRILNTQLASWAERRHDTILYAKPSVTAIAGCSFPKAYIDPYPALYARLRRFAELGDEVVLSLPMKAAKRDRMTAYFATLSKTLGKLEAIATRERSGEPMTEAQLDFINHAVSVHGARVGSGSDIAYTVAGWFADLYYRNESAKFHKPTIVDVHTQPTDESGNMVGRVLHVATARPQLIEVVLGPERTKYRGFVSSYREVITDNFERLDDDWMRLHADTLDVPSWLPAVR